MPRRPTELERLCDSVLVESLPAGVKAAVDVALAAGATKREVLRRVRAAAGRRSLTVLSVEAYLGADQDGRA